MLLRTETSKIHCKSSPPGDIHPASRAVHQPGGVPGGGRRHAAGAAGSPLLQDPHPGTLPAAWPLQAHTLLHGGFLAASCLPPASVKQRTSEPWSAAPGPTHERLAGREIPTFCCVAAQAVDIDPVVLDVAERFMTLSAPVSVLCILNVSACPAHQAHWKHFLTHAARQAARSAALVAH